MINDIFLRGRLAGVKKMNFSEDCEEKRIQVENEWRSSRAIVDFGCFACLQNEKPKTRRASEIPPGLRCENCIHYNRAARRHRKRAGSYICVPVVCALRKKSVAPAQACVRAVCHRLPEIIHTSNLIKERRKDRENEHFLHTPVLNINSLAISCNDLRYGPYPVWQKFFID